MPLAGANPQLVKVAIDEVLWATYSKVPAEGMAAASTPQLFKQIPISNAAAIEMEVMGPAKWYKHNEEENVEETNLAVGNETTHNVENWKQDLPISKEFFDKFIVAFKMPCLA